MLRAGFRRAYVTSLFALAACGGGDGPGIVNAPTVLSVTVTPATVAPIDIGGTVQLSAAVQVENGASQAVQWTSSAAGIATVSASGLVTGVSQGQATITATSTVNAARSGSVTVTVNPPRVVSVTLNSGPRTITVGANFAVQATVETRGTIATTVNFTTSNPQVATVSSTDGRNATIVGVGAGQATITATSTADPTKTATVQVTVSGTVRITSVTPSPVSLRVGQQVTLVPTVQADPGVSAAVTFSSQNQVVATVNGTTGVVAGISVGQTTITVTAVADPNQRVTVPVTVHSGVISVSLTPDVDSLRPGGVKQLALNVATEAGVSNAVAVSSSNPAVVTVDAQLRITGVSVGEAFVRAISTVDATKGDSTRVVVVDACQLFPTIALGTTVNGTISAASCEGLGEHFRYVVPSAMAVSWSATVGFPAEFRVFSAKGAWWFYDMAGGSLTAVPALLAAGTYDISVVAKSTAQRGAFTISSTANVPFTAGCEVFATTALTISQVPLNACGFQPQGRPTGTYSSFRFLMLPPINTGERMTVTVTANGFVPLIELNYANFPPITAIAPGTNTVVQSFEGQVDAGFVSFRVTSRDPGQTGTFTVVIEGPPATTSAASSGAIRATAGAPGRAHGAAESPAPSPRAP